MPRKLREVAYCDKIDDVYYVFWYDKETRRTKRKSLDARDLDVAEDRFAEWLTHGRAFREKRIGLTVTQALDDYWREHVAVKVVDKDRAEDAITHLKEWFGDNQLAEVDIPASRAYAGARRSGKVGGGERRSIRQGSDSTIRRELVVLGAAARHALRWKRITANDLPQIELPAETRSEALADDKYLTREEYRWAVSQADGRLHDFMVLAYETASRRTAIETLTRFQIDLQNNRINLRNPNETDGQRRSTKRRVVVPLTTAARAVIEPRLLTLGPGETYLFGDPAPDLYWPFRSHMEAIGLGHKRNPHILRHSRATHLLQAGVSLWDVAKLLGDTVATVERVYGHFSPGFMAGTLEEKG
ncbi:MAG: tyrosine-type recombinase/integrase [Luteitalea sp.]|nr:tyrosine-type recombinase/integrase [Luteitalea sp.]